MKTTNPRFQTARFWIYGWAIAAMVAALGLASPRPASAGACSDKCQKDYPRSIYHAVPRNACKAKCAAMSLTSSATAKVKAGWERTKEIGAAAVKKVKEVGGAAVKTVKEVGAAAAKKVKNLARGLWDKTKKCIADGLGGCVKKIITAAGNLARGLWDRVKNCVADGNGGCLKRIAKAGLEMACKGVGIFWDAAKKCCAQKGAVQCAKDAAIAVVRKGAKWLCDKFATKVVPAVNKGVSWVINKAGSALKNYKISLRGSEIGALACAFKSALGHTITNMSKKFGDPYLTIKNIVLGAAPHGSTINATLGATASISVPGKQGALSLRLEGEVDGAIDTSCNFEGPLATFGARVTKVGISSIPQWLTDSAVKEFVNPSLGCMSFCPQPIKAAGMNVKIDYCRVIDTCLKNKCTAPVVNTLLSQLFPIALPLAPMLPQKAALDGVRSEIQGWNIGVGGVRFRPGSKDPYRPSISATVSIGPPGRAKFNINATGSLGIKTYCTEKGSMVKVTPSVALKIGDVPKWMQETTLPNMANNYIQSFVNSKGGQNGRFVVNYPSFLSGKKVPEGDKAGAGEVVPSASAHSEGIIAKLKNNWQGIVSAVKTALAGRFRGNANACASVAAPKSSAKGGGGACHLCMKVPDEGSARAPSTASAAAAPDVDETHLGHINASAVNFRSGPGMKFKPLTVLRGCAEFKILERDVAGTQNFWTKAEYKGHVGYIATQYVSRGKSTCRTK
jgi:hypothetical protein